MDNHSRAIRHAPLDIAHRSAYSDERFYERGLAGGSADPFGYALCIILAGLVLAVPLWKLRLTTLADLFRIRFDASVGRTAVLLMVPTSLFWAAAQVRAFGQVLSSASGLEIEITVCIAACVLIAYTIAGGLLADAWTDVVQGIALIFGLGALAWAVIRREGIEILGTVEPGMLNPLGAGPRPLLAILEDWTVPVVGSLVAAEVVARMIAARSPIIARNGTVVAGFAYLMIGLVPSASDWSERRCCRGWPSRSRSFPSSRPATCRRRFRSSSPAPSYPRSSRPWTARYSWLGASCRTTS